MLSSWARTIRGSSTHLCISRIRPKSPDPPTFTQGGIPGSQKSGPNPVRSLIGFPFRPVKSDFVIQPSWIARPAEPVFTHKTDNRASDNLALAEHFRLVSQSRTASRRRIATTAPNSAVYPKIGLRFQSPSSRSSPAPSRSSRASSKSPPHSVTALGVPSSRNPCRIVTAG